MQWVMNSCHGLGQFSLGKLLLYQLCILDVERLDPFRPSRMIVCSIEEWKTSEKKKSGKRRQKNHLCLKFCTKKHQNPHWVCTPSELYKWNSDPKAISDSKYLESRQIRETCLDVWKILTRCGIVSSVPLWLASYVLQCEEEFKKWSWTHYLSS